MNTQNEAETSTPDWWGWSIAVIAGILAGDVLASAVLSPMWCNPLVASIVIGAVVALLVVLVADKKPLGKVVIASVIAAASFAITFTLRHWMAEDTPGVPEVYCLDQFHWQVGWVHPLMLVVAPLIWLCILVPGTLVVLIASAVRRCGAKAE